MHESPQPAQPGISKTRRALGRAPRTRSVVAATALLVVCVAPFASARTGGPLREGLRNGTTTRETQVISNIASTTAATGGYSTRQSNLSNSGGGAVYGCRSQAGGSAATPRPQNPCIRSNNLSTGYAFEFNASHGTIGGLFSVGTGGDTVKPFVTNATGVATGLNADRVDGKGAEDITKDAVNASQALKPFAQVTLAGDAGQTRGVPTGGVTTNPGGANDGVYAVTFTGDLSACALQATIIGTQPGMVTVNPTVATDKATTTVEVRTFNGNNAAADRAFHLSADC
jgi:hypothetical protein